MGYTEILPKGQEIALWLCPKCRARTKKLIKEQGSPRVQSLLTCFKTGGRPVVHFNPSEGPASPLLRDLPARKKGGRVAVF